MGGQVSDSQSTRQSQSDQEFCWQLILRTRPNFSTSHPYAARETSTRLTALYALFSSLEEVFFRVTDEQVAQAKLLWWSTQLLGPEFATSEHPVIRHLLQTGVISSATTGHLHNLLNSTGRRVDHGSVADETGLKALCLVVALDQMKLEWSLGGAVPVSRATAGDTWCAWRCARTLVR
jgi:phytoene/squalene synthetase